MTDKPPNPQVQAALDALRETVRQQQELDATRNRLIVAAARLGATRAAIAEAGGLSAKWVGKIIVAADETSRQAALPPDAEQPHPAAPDGAEPDAAADDQTETLHSVASTDSSSSGLTSTSRAFDPSDGPTI